jgi:antitoxin ParD1/3/4
MHVSLTPKLESYVKAKVRSGLYNNASEVVREALRTMQEQEGVRRLKIEQLRAALVEGERSGSAAPFEMDSFIADLDANKKKRPRRG